MKPTFSFKYGDKEYSLSTKGGASYELGGGVRVSATERRFGKFDATEWVLCFENAGDENSEIFEDIWDCDTLLPLSFRESPRAGHRPTEGDACVITMNGTIDGAKYWENDKLASSEYGLNYEYLDKVRDKTKRFANVGGRSSDGMMPFFDVTSLGAGYIAAVGWTGDWKTEFTKCDSGIRMRSGLKEARFYIKPGESLRTTSVLIMKYEDGEDKHNKFRALVREHFSHKSCTAAERDGLLAFELWGGLPSSEMKKRLAELKEHGVTPEDIWIDAGWYGSCTKCDEAFSGDWSAHTGEWQVNGRVHPDGLRDVSVAARQVGAGLMLWLEPERAIEGTALTVEHPEWFLTKKGTSSKILNYGNEQAWQYVRDLLIGYAKELSFSCYRQDFNVELTEYFKDADEEGRRGITEIKHITGMYLLWDELLASCPGIIIDNCSSGGRRIDIETVRRAIPFFRSDYQCNFNECSEVLQTHNAGISLYLPYNGCTSKTKGDVYAARSSYSSSWGGAFYNAIFQTMSEEDFAWAKATYDEYRRVRGYMSKSFYNHASCVLDESAWAIWQYHDEASQSGIVMAFRRGKSPFDNVTVELKGMRDGATYSYVNLNDGSEHEGKGTLKIELPEKRSSVIFEYKIK